MWTEPEDIKKRWISEKPIPSDDKLEVIISDFESQITNRFPDINERISQGKPSLEFVVTTISRWVIEYLQTDGTQYSSETQKMYGVGERTIAINSASRNSNILSESDLRVFLPKKSGRIISVHMNTKKPYGGYDSIWC